MLILAALAIGPSVAHANDVYIGQSAVGSASGSSCANAKDYTYFNTAGNWTSATPTALQIGPGTTVHLCGTITGTGGVAATGLVAQGNGMSGNPLIILFEPGARLSSPAWKQAINVAGRSYITIDGGIACGTTTGGTDSTTPCNGTIENTQNGSAFKNNAAGSIGINAFPCTFCEFRNLAITNIYVHAQCEAASGCDAAAGTAAADTAIYAGGSGLSIHDSVFHDAAWMLVIRANSGDSNVRIYNNQIYNMDHGVAIYGGNTWPGPLNIYNNHFHDMANWDTGAANIYHHDGIHAFGMVLGEINIYNNIFDGNQGLCCVTAWIFLEGGVAWTDSNGTASVYNNVIIGSKDIGNGQISIGRGNGHRVFNNTIIVSTPGTGQCIDFNNGSTNVSIVNNIVEGCNTLVASGRPAPTSFKMIDYNVYGHSSGGNQNWNYASVGATSLAEWQSACSCDPHSQAISPLSATLPNIGSNGVPSAGFIGLGAGMNLTTLAIGALGALTNDHLGALRPSFGSWTVGAYQLPSTVQPPANLSGIVH